MMLNGNGTKINLTVFKGCLKHRLRSGLLVCLWSKSTEAEGKRSRRRAGSELL